MTAAPTPAPPPGTPPPGAPQPRSPQPGIHQPAIHQPGTPQPAPVRRTSLTGPVVTTSLGVLVLVATLAVGLLTVRAFVGVLSTDVLTSSGAPGPDVVADADAPGMTTAELEAGQRYAVHLAWRDGSGPADPALTEDVLLQAPSGAVLAADGDPAVDSSFAVGAWSITSVAAFTAPESGTYQVAVPPADVDGARVLIAPDQDAAPFVGELLASIAGVFGVILLGSFGTGLVLGGVIWWVVRARARRAAGA
ncbi:hypothetical protein [Cellulomonas shaoxiangyii]|uniref:Uncharacterized protein n=1 Tax=Cellulomonas shaoxiangyii TaxID=2566013 RepID=A0A4P7SEQ8_9CELL|nr:hypothetical protein [Cellulomonas shaoxiangyii]QCB92330.1 hypothetical protein E5225_00920 [Cellulomonas shaoxiangyii]TGY86275.1 hypothetical protein E5226_02945 [Cellulomonas shaoxiangyii]